MTSEDISMDFEGEICYRSLSIFVTEQEFFEAINDWLNFKVFYFVGFYCFNFCSWTL